MCNILFCGRSALFWHLSTYLSFLKKNDTPDSLWKKCKQNYLENLMKIDHGRIHLLFRILKALLILSLSSVLVCMNYVPNQNGKFQEEMLSDFISDAVKTTLRLYYFKMTLFFNFSKNFSPFICHFFTYN